EKCDALRKELYQPPPQLDTVFTPDLTNAKDDDLPFEPVTSTEVCEAIDGCNADSAPGPSQISYLAIKWAWKTEEGEALVTALMQKCTETGYHPKPWRKAVAIALRKPGKPDYSNPRAYRLITLLECLGKILEK
ncbi:hypothetical protein BDN72DRAFT_725113, partial [Pluteus cervinus]